MKTIMIHTILFHICIYEYKAMELYHYLISNQRIKCFKKKIRLIEVIVCNLVDKIA